MRGLRDLEVNAAVGCIAYDCKVKTAVAALPTLPESKSTKPMPHIFLGVALCPLHIDTNGHGQTPRHPLTGAVPLIALYTFVSQTKNHKHFHLLCDYLDTTKHTKRHKPKTSPTSPIANIKLGTRR